MMKVSPMLKVGIGQRFFPLRQYFSALVMKHLMVSTVVDKG
jgi:hypothetical protein